MGGVNFAVDEPQKYREKAREEAIANAKIQAEKLAKTLGIKLGKITNIVESSPQAPISYIKTLRSDVAQAAPVIEPGTETVTSVVTLYFEKK